MSLDNNQLTFLHTDKVKLVKITENSKFIISMAPADFEVWRLRLSSKQSLRSSPFLFSRWQVIAKRLSSLSTFPLRIYKGLRIPNSNSRKKFWSIIRVWSISDPNEKFNLEGHEDGITCIDATSDSKYVISASTDSTVRVWYLNTKRHINSLEGNNARHKFLKITANNRLIICGSYDYFIRIWRTEEWPKETAFSGHEGEVRHSQITKDGRPIYSAGSPDNTIMIWNSEKHKENCPFKLPWKRGHSFISITWQ
ncbi:unnamed protein product [Blepharisma stoltei]|uniref:Uncharacterized protein n=1 Tax=Blepharisma stoltei TaxID=1481888 RepID=A0AAU9J5U9_9CILI|nr:unnamed protein product [Blepharisma stoltei]